MEGFWTPFSVTLSAALVVATFTLIFKQFVIKTKTAKILEFLTNEHATMLTRLNDVEKTCEVVEHLSSSLSEIEHCMRVMTPCVYAMMIQAEYPERKSNGEFTKAKDAMRRFVLYRESGEKHYREDKYETE